MTHYEILGLAPGATDDDIKKAYRKLAMQHHPDRTQGDDTQFKAIKLAYEVLSDPDRRARYDATGDSSQPPTRRQAAESMVPGLAAETLQEMFRNPFIPPSQVDAIEKMRDKVRSAVKHALKEYSNMERDKERAEKLVVRFKRSPGTGENMLAGAIAADIAALASNMEKNLEHQLLMSEMLEVLNDYSFDVEKPIPADTGWTTISYST